MININGTIWGTQGYSVHTKNLARALNKIKPVKLTTQLMPGWEMQVEDDVLEMIKRPGQITENIMIMQPLQWRFNIIPEARNIGFLVFEGDKIPECWVEECMNPEIELILVPSNHTKQAILNTAPVLENKIHIIPHGTNFCKTNPIEKGKTFSFLSNKGYRNEEDRGGIQYVVKAFMEEFKDDDVELILKINPAYGLGMLPVHPKIKVIPEVLDEQQMIELYQNCDVFVSPSRAEAFNIPCLEALALGKPVITTNFGGQTDFCNDKNSWIIGGELKEVEHEILYEGIKWLTPDIKELKKAMREAFEDKKLTEEKGKEALKTASNMKWEDSAKKLYNLLDRVGGDSVA